MRLCLTAWLFLPELFLPGCCFCKKLFTFIFCHGFRIFVVIIIFEELRKEIFRLLALGITHHVDGAEHILCYELMQESVALAIASDDALCLPKGDVIQEIVSGNAYLAYEQFIKVAGGQTFFLFFPPFGSFSFGSSLGK